MEYIPITVQELKFKFNPGMEYGDNIYLLLLALPAGRSLFIPALTKNRGKFIDEVKFCCELLNITNIEFDNNYTYIQKTLSAKQELDLIKQKSAIRINKKMAFNNNAPKLIFVNH
ncbi:MAG: hypothetical protein LBU42_00590 [Prevotellaceae bacterium]|jgi:hypothetical protein|nr:hypothetical protein [Prevotellaceae bacterium]